MTIKKCALATLGTAAMLLSACDSTVGIDPTTVSLTGVSVAGACRVDDSLSTVDVSVILEGPQNLGLEPGTRVQRQEIDELISASNFEWAKVADSEVQGTFAGTAKNIESGLTAGIDLRTDDVDFEYVGGLARRDDPRLVVLALDHSGSLVGEDLVNGGIRSELASDGNDQHITFLRSLVSQMSTSVFFSVVSFQGELPTIDDGENNDGPAVPTRNRDITLEALRKLERDATGTTPLARTLRDTLSSVLLPNTRKENGDNDLNGALVLFTDGVELGDPTDTEDGAGIRQAITDYQAAEIPVFVIELRPVAGTNYPRERSARLVELACATGGEYFFIESADEFTKTDLSGLLRNRLRGAWKARTTTTLSNPAFDPGAYLVATQLSVTLGAVTAPARLALSRDSQSDFEDTRLWFAK